MRRRLAALAVAALGRAAGESPLPPPPAAPATSETTYPINLATAFQLAGARALDVQIAARQAEIASRALDRAKVLWVPNLAVGADLFHHAGPQQNFLGETVESSRSSMMAGFGPNVVFNPADAIYAPLAARQDVRARLAQRQAALNDTTLAVAEAYFDVQQARGDLAGALLAEEQARSVAEKAEELSRGLAPPLEASRARVELARRRAATVTARERWRVRSAELSRILRLPPGVAVQPMEPPTLQVPVIQADATLDELIPVGLRSRPELAGQQAVVQATLARLKTEKLRPLVPSLALRSVATNPSGSLGYGAFGGGPNDTLRRFGGRLDVDLQILWEFQNLGFGNRARVGERRAEFEAATLELFRTQDRVAAEVSAAFAQVGAASERVSLTEPALRDALDLVSKSVQGMGQTRRVGDSLVLVVRPQEVVAAIQSLGTAIADYHAAVGDYNRAQFRLYRALGHPAEALADAVPCAPAPAPQAGEKVPPPPLPPTD